MTKNTRNLLLCRIASLLIVVMLFRYRAIFMTIQGAGSQVFVVAIVAIFYVLNIITLVGLFFRKSWGFITSYFALPISTFLFAVSYVPFIIDWLPMPLRMYSVPFLNAFLLVGIVYLQVHHRRH